MIFLLSAIAMLFTGEMTPFLSLKEQRMLPSNSHSFLLLPYCPRIEQHKLTNCSYACTVSPCPLLSNHPQLFLLFFFNVFGRKMQKNDNYFQSFGICQRLFNFFMNNLIVCPLKSITLGHADPVPRSSIEVSVDDSLRNGVGEQEVPLILKTTNGEEKLHHQGQERSKDTGSGSEIQVHFKQTEEELELWTPVDKLGFSAHESTKGSQRTDDGDQPKMKNGESIPISLSGKGQLPDDKLAIQKRKKVTEPPHDKEELPLVQVNGAANGMTARGKTQQETEPNMSTMAREKGPKKLDSIQDSKEEDRTRKGKDIISENLTPAREEPEEVLPRHLISVAANINEKSDAFIRRKKEAWNQKKPYSFHGWTSSR